MGWTKRIAIHDRGSPCPFVEPDPRAVASAPRRNGETREPATVGVARLATPDGSAGPTTLGEDVTRC